MKVLHDWDRPYISRGWARLRGTSLLLYALSQKVPIFYRIPFFRQNRRKVEEAQIEFMETLIKLDHILGIEPIFGIRDGVRERYPERIAKLEKDHDLDIRRHTHIGVEPDPHRKRLWDPPLNQPRHTWDFDTKWINGEKVELNPGELPIWHVDNPHHLTHYINFLYEVKKKRHPSTLDAETIGTETSESTLAPVKEAST